MEEPDDGPALTLFIETADGAYIRIVQSASGLSADRDLGDAAEEATRSAAASWGLPDFVFRSAPERRGSGRRELGDAILIVGRMGASVQVKARQAESNRESRERSWLDKKIRQATSQARGTIRSLQSVDRVTLVNERGREVAIRPKKVRWLRVVVVDHSGLDDYVPPAGAVVLLRRDWEFLFDQLRSTYAVLEYLERVGDGDPIPLGEEPVRYYELAAADAATPPSEVDARLAAFGSDAISRPLLPQAPIGHGEDRLHILLRVVLEDMAIATLPAGQDAADMLEVLAGVDAVPVGYRAELGRTILRWLSEVAEVPDPAVKWRFRLHTWPGRPFIVFAAASRHNTHVQTGFVGYISLRHQEFIELMPERSDVMTVGVLLTPRHDGLRPWDTTMVATTGDQGIESTDRALLESAWGKLGERRAPNDSDNTG